MKWCAAVLTAVVLASAGLLSASVDPGRNTSALVLAFCDNGQAVLLNFGTPTNRSHQAFVLTSSGTISTTSIYVVKELAFTSGTGTTVIFDTAPGLTDLVACTAPLISGVTIGARGFFTSRGVEPAVRTSSRLLCLSYGGTFAAGPDEIGGLDNPVVWVCNGVPVANDGESFFNKLDALGVDCVADGGSVLYATATLERSNLLMNATCYGPASGSVVRIASVTVRAPAIARSVAAVSVD